MFLKTRKKTFETAKKHINYGQYRSAKAVLEAGSKLKSDKLEDLYLFLVNKNYEYSHALVSYQGEKKNTIAAVRAVEILTADLDKHNEYLRAVGQVIFRTRYIDKNDQKFINAVRQIKNGRLRYGDNLKKDEIISFFTNIIGWGFDKKEVIKIIADSNYNNEVICDLTSILINKYKINNNEFYQAELTSICNKVKDVPKAKQLINKIQ